MHFGPEWMRTKHAPTRPAPSPPLATNPASPAVSSYSALVAPASQPPPEKSDLARPFRYSKEDLLRIYREGGGKGGLGLEVERWEGIVREVGHDPIGLKEMSEAERKIFAGSLNSEIRRRQSTDYLSPLNTSLGERPKLGHTTSAGSPLRERMGTFAGRRRDSTDQPPLTLPRKPSFSSMSGPLASPRDAPLPSPRVRVGSGFDGVLDGSWTSKRRAAEGLAKSSSRTDLKDDQGIKEEEEEATHLGDPGNSATPENGTLEQQNGSSLLNDEGNLGSTSQSVPPQESSIPPTVPPGIANPDPASVEWSYLDPQGQIQGPFRADVMQKWFDEGYFNISLMMRRTHIDTEWTSVGDLLQQTVNGGKIFLGGPPKPRPNIPEHVYSAPLEPVPSRALRTTGLDSYFQTGSNASNSPTSSFSAGRFGNNSPDPSMLANRMGGPQGVGAFNGLNSMEPQRRVYDEPFEIPTNGRPYGGYSPARGGHVDPLLFNDRAPSYSPGFDNASFNTTRPNLDMSVINGQNNAPVFGTNSPVPIGGGFGHQEQPRIIPLHKNRPGVESRLSGYSSENGSPFLQQAQPSPQIPETLYQNGVPLGNEHAGGSHVQTLPQQQLYPIQPVSPWGIPETRRLGPFEADYPTARNTTIIPRTVVPVQQPLANIQPSPVHPPQSPWASVPHAGTYDHWVQDSNRAPASTIEVAPQVEQEQATAQPVSVQASPAIPEATRVETKAPEPASSSQTVVPSPPTEPPVTRPKKQRKEPSASTLKLVSPTPAPASIAVPAKTPSPAPSPADTRPAWAVDEEKPSTVTSLREIQELEAKRAEARKASERAARAAAAATTTSSSTEELQSFTASWGLPISQAGATRSNPLLKDASSSSASVTPSSSSQAVWTNAAKTTAAKKTMKEIQEEEEKRKKQSAKEKETVAAAARRAYAETTTKIIPSAQSTGVWTTVGTGGKTSSVTAASPATARPAATVTTTPSKTSTPVVSTIATPSRPACVASKTHTRRDGSKQSRGLDTKS
ncbi:hypothetical protein QCA50_001354 [Cerrena zonata]|uniref:GYF domain-containing protein n=1 Tax=Cerrena zonata TaxID=2478898 RepID=A0AAW0GSZ6_9APHY